jgi:hypothetical protein
MALIPADELASLEETARLLRSPKNAVRRLSALARSNGCKTRTVELEELRRQLGIDQDTLSGRDGSPATRRRSRDVHPAADDRVAGVRRGPAPARGHASKDGAPGARSDGGGRA